MENSERCPVAEEELDRDHEQNLEPKPSPEDLADYNFDSDREMQDE